MKKLIFLPCMLLICSAHAQSGMGPWNLLWIPFFIILFTFINCIMIANVKDGNGLITFINFILYHIVGIFVLMYFHFIIGIVLAGLIIFIEFLGILSWAGLKNPQKIIIKKSK